MADWNAEVYARVSAPQFEWGQRVLERLPLAGDETVVDAGCGAGRLTELLLKRLPRGRVVALDASRAMLVEARSRLARFGEQVTFVRADLATHVERPPVDAVFSTATFHWVLDHDALFAGLHATLRSGGRLVAQWGGATLAKLFIPNAGAFDLSSDWRTLGVAPEAVTLRESVQGKDLTGNHTGGSRSLVGAGSVCKLAAQKLIEQARPLAAEELELEPSQIDYSEGAFHQRGGEKMIGLLDLAQKHAGRNPHPLDLVAEGTVGSTFPNGCHIAEVEVDPETGVTEIVSYVAVDDSGNVIDHSVVEGQVHGGVTQGAGQVFGEHAMYDHGSGQLLTGSFSDYFMPRAGFIRDIQINDHPVPSKTNVLGAKGFGESGCTASLPTLANATLDALRPLGIQHLDMPLTPSKLWHAMQAAKT